MERAMLDCDPIRFGSQEAEPNPRGPVVRGRPNGTGVMPQLSVDRLSERQATVAGNDAVKRCLPDLLEFDRCNSGRKNEAIHDVDAPMDHCKSIASDFNVDRLLYGPPNTIREPSTRNKGMGLGMMPSRLSDQGGRSSQPDLVAEFR